MTHRDFLWCALNLALDDEEELARLCPTCRVEAEEARCPVCGAKRSDCGDNSSFDQSRFNALKEV